MEDRLEPEARDPEDGRVGGGQHAALRREAEPGDDGHRPLDPRVVVRLESHRDRLVDRFALLRAYQRRERSEAGDPGEEHAARRSASGRSASDGESWVSSDSAKNIRPYLHCRSASRRPAQAAGPHLKRQPPATGHEGSSLEFGIRERRGRSVPGRQLVAVGRGGVGLRPTGVERHPHGEYFQECQRPGCIRHPGRPRGSPVDDGRLVRMVVKRRRSSSGGGRPRRRSARSPRRRAGSSTPRPPPRAQSGPAADGRKPRRCSRP